MMRLIPWASTWTPKLTPSEPKPLVTVEGIDRLLHFKNTDGYEREEGPVAKALRERKIRKLRKKVQYANPDSGARR